MQNNHHIVYDKLLKELKLHALKQGWFVKRCQDELAKHAITARAERRHWFKYPRCIDKTTGKRLYRPLVKLCSLKQVLAFDSETNIKDDMKNQNVSINFSGIRFFDPEILPLIAKQKLKEGLFDKSVDWSDGKPSALRNAFRAAKIKQRKYSIKLEENWYEKEKQKLVTKLVETVRLSEMDVIKLEQYQNYQSWWRSTNTNLLFNYDTPVRKTINHDKDYGSWRNALVSKHPLTIVYGGAGTGKTRLLLERAQWLIDEQRIKPKKVNSIAFTNAAVDELSQRYASNDTFKKYGSPKLSTFTSWCGQMLNLNKESFEKTTFLDLEEYDNKREKYLIDKLAMEKELSKKVDEILSFASKDVKSYEWSIAELG